MFRLRMCCGMRAESKNRPDLDDHVESKIVEVNLEEPGRQNVMISCSNVDRVASFTFSFASNS
jgi:hypothetical protein